MVGKFWSHNSSLIILMGKCLSNSINIPPLLLSKLYTLYTLYSVIDQLHCAGFSWDRVNLLQSSQFGAVFWNCTGNSADYTGVFSLPLSSIYPEPRPFLPLIPPISEEYKDAKGVERGHQDS